MNSALLVATALTFSTPVPSEPCPDRVRTAIATASQLEGGRDAKLQSRVAAALAIAANDSKTPAEPKSTKRRVCTCGDNCECENCDGSCSWTVKAASPYEMTYDRLLEYVAGGGKHAILVVNSTDPFKGSYQLHCRVDVGFKGLAKGNYFCGLYQGVASFRDTPWVDVVTASPVISYPAASFGTFGGSCSGGACSTYSGSGQVFGTCSNGRCR